MGVAWALRPEGCLFLSGHPPTTMIPFLGYHPLYRLESERVGRVTSLGLSVLAVKQVQPSAVSKSVF